MLPPKQSTTHSKYSKMSSYSKKFVTSFLRDSVNVRPLSLTRLFDSYSLQEVKVVEPNFPKGEALLSPYDTYTVVTMNPITLEEQLSIYPVVVIHKMPGAPNTVIDIE
jgi:hypothetical protein